jgi:hypothetical protein
MKKYGIIPLVILIWLCVYSMYDSPEHWADAGNAPFTYLAENKENLNGKIQTTGIVRNLNNDGFDLTYPAYPVMNYSIPVVGGFPGLIEGSDVFVSGEMKNGKIIVEKIHVNTFLNKIDIIFNIAGALFLLFIILSDWKINFRKLSLEYKNNNKIQNNNKFNDA